MKNISAGMVMSAFVATITVSAPAMAAPPRLQSPTPCGESLDVLKEHMAKERAKKINLKILNSGKAPSGDRLAR